MSTETGKLYREDVALLHGVHVYRGNGDGGIRGDRFVEDSHPLEGRCICHHAIWHSCPVQSEGKRMFERLPSRPIGAAPRDELAEMRAELDSLRRRVSDLEMRQR